MILARCTTTAGLEMIRPMGALAVISCAGEQEMTSSGALAGMILSVPEPETITSMEITGAILS